MNPSRRRERTWHEESIEPNGGGNPTPLIPITMKRIKIKFERPSDNIEVFLLSVIVAMIVSAILKTL